MEITTIGIDLAKNVFQVHGIDAQGKTVLKNGCKGRPCMPDKIIGTFIEREYYLY
ncbi:hypothetical protein [Xenorhabdus miraniensis]|uniref:Transposase n=1 Tax=Xenorhabdus miraniensis TaxID=351674 RepID=A0A2D0JS68_9GAMM|nr:hypothetical protein [Xenorhabdus miraniensis]PHM49190.1 transposase [Xenorhabdus miraniensis]